MKLTAILLLLSLLLVAGCAKTIEQNTQDNAQTNVVEDDTSSDDSGGEEIMSVAKNRYAVIETNMGKMKLELYEQRAPITTANFIKLVEQGYYDGIIFHRVIDGFMIQGGDPEGTGRGGPGYSIKDEFHPELRHNSAGILSMANAGPNTGGSQFFITLAPTAWLDDHHAVFGKVVEGLDVLQAIGKVKTAPGDKPLEDVVMTKVTIVDQ